ncbi:MAG TPA: hypothetical protein VMM57_07140 [Bacteroidota bacterium]|nr:hypothetical protein [Bacteroidota bacterium]
MRTLTSFAVLIVLGAGLAIAQEMKDAPSKTMDQKQAMKTDMTKPHVMRGYLVDMMCGKRMGNGDVEKSNAKAAKHTTKCALDDACAESGYGLVYDGKWSKFDDAGDKLAAAWLAKTTLKDNLLVDVTCTMDGDMMKVSAIKPATVKKDNSKMEPKKTEKSDTKM